MRLTNTDRDAFIAAVMQDVPHTDYDELVRTAVQKWAVDHLPAKVKAVYKDFPDYIVTEVVWQLPSPFKNVRVVAPDGGAVLTAMKKDGPFWRNIVEMAEKAKAQTKQRDALKAKLRSCIYACTTAKQARERMPEFAAYLPDDEPAPDRSLPAVGDVVADLNAAGWQPKKAAA